MRLQKMKYRSKTDGKVRTYVCAVNKISVGGEFTVCGNDTVESSLDDRLLDFEPEGDEFEGEISDITCGGCKAIIKWFKNL